MEPRLRFNLDELLKQNKLKASDLSKLTGIPKQTLSEWRSGLVPKSILSLKKIASTFGISLDELVFRSSEDKVQPLDAVSGDSLGSCAATKNEALLGLGPNGVPHFVSPAYQERTGWSRDILGQRSLFEFILGSDCENFQEALQTALESGQPVWVTCRLLCSDLRILQQRCLVVPLSSKKAALAIFYPDAAGSKAFANGIPLIDEVVSLDLKAVLTEIKRNFQTLQPHLSLKLATLPSDLSFFSRRNTFSQLIFSCLQEIAPMGDSAASLASQELELVAYRDEQALEINIRSPVAPLTPERQGQISLAPVLKPALGAKVEFKDWGSLRQVVITLPLETPHI